MSSEESLPDYSTDTYYIYWQNYDFEDLLEDIRCTVYSEYAVALDIYDALCKTSEEEDITLFDPTRLRGKLLVRFQRPQQAVESITIRYKTS